MVATGDGDNVSTWIQMQRWFAGPLGNVLVQLEQEQLDSILPDLFGYHIVQVGQISNRDLLQASRISHRVVLSLGSAAQEQGLPQCLAAAIPIAAQSVDVVLLPHVLEYEPDPHIVLREAERILIGEGHIVVFGFNPWSFWGVWRLLLSRQGRVPWSGDFLSMERVKDWLHVLGFDILETRNFFFRPPIKSTWLHQRLRFLESTGEFLWPYFSGVYVIVGRKRLVTLTRVGIGRRHRVSIEGVVGQPTCCVPNE